MLSPEISTSEIDDIYSRGIDSGALGGKLLGAGGGGFILFYAPKDRHQRIIDSLGEKMFVPFRFDSVGSSVIYFSH
jgi:D-glycero-alpha-D-manno-heptose-7-phosphate kinase